MPGQRLRFVRQTKHFDRGDTVEVVATVENGLRVRRADGTEVNFIPASVAASFDVGEARELKVSPLVTGCCCKPTTARSSSTASASKSGRSKTAALPWPMAARSRPGSTPSPTATPSRRTVPKARPWTRFCWSPRRAPSGPSTASSFTFRISRGRERVHVFTDDADLLARRVTDSHTRKAAVELQALRDGLAKLGFIPKERLEEKTAAPVGEDSRALRQRRPMRQTRLSTVQRLATAVEDVRRWLGLDQTEAIEQKETVAEKVGPAESVKQTEAVQQTETVKPARTVREALRHHQAHRQQQRRSGGIHI